MIPQAFWVDAFQQAFSSALSRRKLIATGAVRSDGAAPINIWVSTSGGKNRVSVFMGAGSINVTVNRYSLDSSKFFNESS